MSKKRVSLTLNQTLLKRVDAEADHRSLNRSQMVEEIIEDYIRGQTIDTAVILCGDPDLSPLKEINGRPVLSHILEGLQDKGLTRAIILAGGNREKLQSHFGEKGFGITLDYVSDEVEGPAEALKKLEDRIGKTFLVLNGDVVLDLDIEDMVSVHRQEDSVATMALRTADDPSQYGVVRMKGRTVLGFEEKPEPGEEPTRLVNAGAYIFEPEAFSILEEDLDSFFEELSSEKQLSGYIYGGKWDKAD
ncbi:MAG: sugar phosphate nucleotidyltransferase [Candidatus Nanohaloarchaea archaeon]